MIRVYYYERGTGVYKDGVFQSRKAYESWLDRNRGTRVMRVIG